VPTYDFVCPRCEGEEELFFKSFNDPGINSTKCSVCGTVLKKVVKAAPEFILTGAGWPGKESKGK